MIVLKDAVYIQLEPPICIADIFFFYHYLKLCNVRNIYIVSCPYSMLIHLAYSIQPVSYTHLDVYKRQEPMSLPLKRV